MWRLLGHACFEFFHRYQKCLPLFKEFEARMAQKPPHRRSANEYFSSLMTKYRTPDVIKYLMCMEVGTPIKSFITKRGYIGFGPISLQQADVVCVCFGSNVPCVLRRRGCLERGYTLIGDAYVYGIMDGELVNDHCNPVELEI